MDEKIMNTAADWETKLILANFNQDSLSKLSCLLLAIKKEIVLSKEAVNAVNTKIWPTWPIHRCSPSNCIIFSLVLFKGSAIGMNLENILLNNRKQLISNFSRWK